MGNSNNTTRLSMSVNEGQLLGGTGVIWGKWNRLDFTLLINLFEAGTRFSGRICQETKGERKAKK